MRYHSNPITTAKHRSTPPAWRQIEHQVMRTLSPPVESPGTSLITYLIGETQTTTSERSNHRLYCFASQKSLEVECEVSISVTSRVLFGRIRKYNCRGAGGELWLLKRRFRRPKGAMRPQEMWISPVRQSQERHVQQCLPPSETAVHTVDATVILW